MGRPIEDGDDEVIEIEDSAMTYQALAPIPSLVGSNPPNTPPVMQQRMQQLGAILHLMMQSPLHRTYQLKDLEERFIPSLLHNQFRYYEINGTPIGFVNWAWLTDELEAKYTHGQYELGLDEWVGGAHLWFPEFIAPFGHARTIIRDLRNNIFEKGTPAKALRISSAGELTGISHYRV